LGAGENDERVATPADCSPAYEDDDGRDDGREEDEATEDSQGYYRPEVELRLVGAWLVGPIDPVGPIRLRDSGPDLRVGVVNPTAGYLVVLWASLITLPLSLSLSLSLSLRLCLFISPYLSLSRNDSAEPLSSALQPRLIAPLDFRGEL
jgi:hypothetical protein